jgi:hypothetical protein
MLGARKRKAGGAAAAPRAPARDVRVVRRMQRVSVGRHPCVVLTGYDAAVGAVRVRLGGWAYWVWEGSLSDLLNAALGASDETAPQLNIAEARRAMEDIPVDGVVAVTGHRPHPAYLASFALRIPGVRGETVLPPGELGRVVASNAVARATCPCPLQTEEIEWAGSRVAEGDGDDADGSDSGPDIEEHLAPPVAWRPRKDDGGSSSDGDVGGTDDDDE